MANKLFPALKLCVPALVCLLFLATAVLRGQAPSQPGGQANVLPPATGEPLTIAPVDLPDIDCVIQDWEPGPPKPVLTLLCPPREVFAPLRVYLRLSWMRPQDVPGEAGKVIALPGGSTKIRTNGTAVMVRLEVAGESSQRPQARWVGFTGVVDVALIKDSPRRWQAAAGGQLKKR